MTGFRTYGVVVLLLALLVPSAGPDAVQAQKPPAAGRIDFETANRMVADYAGHVLSLHPRDWRQAQERKWRDNPPGLGPHHIYQLNGSGGPIVFEYDPGTRRLLCRAVIFKPRREYPLIGLTRQEILTALKRAEAAGINTGGGEVTYEPISDGFFLLRAYERPPEKSEQMNRELDRLTAAGAEWTRKHYLEAVRSYARTLKPPPSATARDGLFEVTLVLTPDVRYHGLWRRPPGAIQPQLVSRLEYTHGQEVWAMALFRGATAGEGGSARFEAQYSFVYPNGREVGSQVFTFWDGPPPPQGHLQMVENRVSIALGADKAPGDYLARVKVCNVFTERCVVAESPFRVFAGSGP